MTVHAFPSARHQIMVETIASNMRATGSADAAEQLLIAHLEVHWDRLEAFGVDCDDIERECRAFAVAAWAGFQQKATKNSPGAA
jgi:hypothetical protein